MVASALAAGLPRGNDKIDRATATLRADEASSPFGDGQIGAIACGLFAGIDVDYVPAAIAPSAQQQACAGGRAERRGLRGVVEALPPHRNRLPIPRAHERAAPT